MFETSSRKIFFVELLLFVVLFGAAASLLFPNIWKPVLSLVVELEQEEPQPDLLATLPAPGLEKKIVRIQSHSNIGEFRTSVSRKFDTNSLENQFEPREMALPEDWIVEPADSLGATGSLANPRDPFDSRYIKEDVPPPLPDQQWEIQDLVSSQERQSQDTESVQTPKDGDALKVPDLRPNGISNEVIGTVEPILDIPGTPRRNFVGDDIPQYVDEHEFRSIMDSGPNLNPTGNAKNGSANSLAWTDPTWWIREIQSPQLGDRQPMPISLDTIILMALQKAPEVQVLNTEPEIQRTLIDQNIAAFDWSTFINTVWTDTNIPVGDTLQTGLPGGRFLENELSVEGGITKLLATGGDIRLGQTFGRRDNNSQFLVPNDQGTSNLVIDYRQPLLRGAGRRFAQRQIVQARLDFEQVQSQSMQGLQQYVVDVVAAYWQLYQARALAVQTRRSFHRADELLQRLRNREGIDVTNDQILRAEAAAGSRKSEAISAEFEVRNAQDVLINLVVGPDSKDANFLELIPEPMLLPEHIPYDLETLAYVALNNRPEISEAIARIKTGETLEYVAVNELLPQLDAILSTSVSGLRGNFDAFGAFADQFSRGDPSYSIGFEFELPVGNRVAKSVVQRQQLQTRIFTQQFEKSVGDVVLDVKVAARNLDRLNQAMQNNLAALQKAAQELEYIRNRQELLLDDGKTGSLYIEDLLASQARLTLAESRLLESQTDHAIALVDLKRATGELLNAKYHADQFLPMEVEYVNHIEPAFQDPSHYPTAIPTEIELHGSSVVQPNNLNTNSIGPAKTGAGQEYFAPVYAPLPAVNQ